MFRAFDEDPFFAEFKRNRGDMLGEMNSMVDNMHCMMGPQAIGERSSTGRAVGDGKNRGKAGVRRPTQPVAAPDDIFSGLMISNMGSLLPKMAI